MTQSDDINFSVHSFLKVSLATWHKKRECKIFSFLLLIIYWYYLSGGLDNKFLCHTSDLQITYVSIFFPYKHGYY